MAVCSRCEGRISIFSKKRRCPKCSRRVCKECVKEDTKAAPSSTPGRALSSFGKSNSSWHMPNSSNATLLPRASTMNTFCPLGCRDVKHIGGAGDDERLSGDLLEVVPPPSPPDMSSSASASSPRDATVEAADTPSPTTITASTSFRIDAFTPTPAKKIEDTKTTDMVDAATGFVVSFSLCMIWSVVSSAIVNHSFIYSPTGLGAAAILLGIVFAARQPRSSPASL
ncbi:unnamed protein product [Aphanomyces euteiches]|uniref:Uncharacterized protein n=1 Tax=Aphanomyces euteiches TaxID=100861 RepID=A0A6G0X685_9STRA|nr:hypothetical protein Ae201684_008079 [Aphanomyces euteiches]KAH9074549.1 hypothetical protein Ae201684P_022355 [Aphanomyces euteiches]KAH9096388.1 hypothetical protein LEN26_017506 [Aphanomyces euteiches]KAH9111323.1 hypothetical protein AeMF1_014120 [Aphanomyces euteiches]KAH9155998.1 hypothetical protein AeRB84_002062 [Aphanomyces euteiches]